MSLLAASRQAVKLAHQLRVFSLLSQSCGESYQNLFDHKKASGIRHCFQQAYTGCEDDGDPTRKTNNKSKTKITQKTYNRQTKLHSRVLSDEELADNREFLSQRVITENKEDTFGTLKHQREANKSSKLSSRLKTNIYGDKLSDEGSLQNGGHETDSTSNFAKIDVPSENMNKVFTPRARYNQQNHKWSEVFGTLGEDSLADRIEESLSTAVGSHGERFSDDEDEQESMRIRLSGVNRRHIPEWYGRKILKLGKQGKVRDALEVLEEWMLKEDRVRPNAYVFTCLITVLGRAGYTKKAFSLFRKMRSMGIQPKPATYTSLFNACANSPWKNDGLARADNLLRLMKEKDIKPTFITGKAMVKAFAMCGDLRRAFSLVDELSKVYRPDPEVFSFLLMACISDGESGLRHAIQVWRLMEQMGVQPDRPLYNLLLRCVRDCGVGDLPSFTTLITSGATTTTSTSTTSSKLDAGSGPQMASFSSQTKGDNSILEIEAVDKAVKSQCMPNISEGLSSLSHSEQLEWQQEQALSENDRLTSRETEVTSEKVLQSALHLGNEESGAESRSSSLAVHSSVTIPDLLSANQQLNEHKVVSLGDLSTKEKRLLLLGGVEGVLGRMARDRVRPDVITFTQLLSVAWPTVEAETALLDTMRALHVRPDIDLINALIHKRCMRADFAAAKVAKELVVEFGLTANQMTYGVLAMTCRTQREGAELLEDMEAVDMAVNMEILGTLMYASGMKFGYKLWILRQAQHMGLAPNHKFLQNVERGLDIVRHKMVQAERQGHTDSHLLSQKFQHSVETFTHNYESWLKQTQLEQPGHPWASFRPRASTTQHTDTENV